jgi:hypothetical protein
LWLEAGVTGGPDMNWVYNFFMTKTRDIRADCSFLTVGTLQSGPRHPSLDVEKLVE